MPGDPESGLTLVREREVPLRDVAEREVAFPDLSRKPAAMNAGAWQGFARVHVLGRVPGFVMSRSVLHLPDTSWLLRGVAMVSAPSQDSFWLWVFVQPLYVPANRLVFRYGHQLARMSDRGLTDWPTRLNLDLGTEIATSVRSQALPMLDKVRRPADMLDVARSQPGSGTDLDHLETVAYSAVLTGDGPALRLVGQQVRELPRGTETGEAEFRLRRVLAGYERDAAGTVTLLRRWRDATARSLRLP
jgi:hypothetical protein